MKNRNEESKKPISALLLGVLGVVMLGTAVAMVMFAMQNPKPQRATQPEADVSAPKPAPESNRLSAAKMKALAWSPDALLVGASTSVDSSDIWIYEFSSSTKKGKVDQITVTGTAVTAEQEIARVVEGGEVPVDIITSEQAKAKALAIPGYADAKILGVEMLYGPDGKQWYWGVKTDHGVVSVKATK
jgi:hypothetical protein